MPKFIIAWNAGYGSAEEIVQADTQAEAEKYAYEAWREDVESNADYSAEPYTQERAIDLGLEDEPDEDAA